MAAAIGAIKGKLLLLLDGQTEPVELGTIEVPITVSYERPLQGHTHRGEDVTLRDGEPDSWALVRGIADDIDRARESVRLKPIDFASHPASALVREATVDIEIDDTAIQRDLAHAQQIRDERAQNISNARIGDSIRRGVSHTGYEYPDHLKQHEARIAQGEADDDTQRLRR